MKSKANESWAEELIAEINKFALKGDYKSALAIARRAYQKYPTEFVARYQYAKILGDFADELPQKQKIKMKRESISILKPLLRTLSGKPVALRFGICLNYYYQSENFLGMFKFAKKFSKHDKQRSFYGMGLAATLISQQKKDASLEASSFLWAKKAVQFWSRYDLKKDTYYFAHYSAAKAYAFAQRPQISLQHLNRASKLAKRPITDWEFADVTNLLNKK